MSGESGASFESFGEGDWSDYSDDLPGADYGSGYGSGPGHGPGHGFGHAGGGVAGEGDGPRRDPLQRRVDALGELLGLSRTRVEPDALAEAGELLDRIAERRRLSLDHTVVALAGATGSGKSSLFNALTGLELSQVGVRRPTTAEPVACAWDPRGAVGLLDRLGIAPHMRLARRSLLDGVHTRPGGSDAGFEGLVLLDLPDHDSAAEEHRRQVDRLLELVDVVVWVVDPEKYADALLHERYLRPLSGHADVTLIVLNQVDRLPYEAADQVLDDLRRLLDEDGLAVGEHGEAGAVVLAASALTGEGVADVRATIGQIVAERGAANRRLAADVGRATERLRPVYIGRGASGLTESAREAFAARLADAVGVTAVGRTAEREWADAAARACGVPWGRLVEKGEPAEPTMPGDGPEDGCPVAGVGSGAVAAGGVGSGAVAAGAVGSGAVGVGEAWRAYGVSVSGAAVGSGDVSHASGGVTSRHATPTSGGVATAGAPPADGAVRTPEDVHASASPRATHDAGRHVSGSPRAPHDVNRRAAARPLVAEGVRVVAAAAAEGLPAPWAQAVHDAARRGSRGLPEALDAAAAAAEESHLDRPRWWSAAGLGQWLLMVLSVTGAVGLVAVAVQALAVPMWLPVVVCGVGTVGSPALAWACRAGSRGLARRYGQNAERRLRDAAADCGSARVLEPVAAELLRYQQVREQYGIATGALPDARR